MAIHNLPIPERLVMYQCKNNNTFVEPGIVSEEVDSRLQALHFQNLDFVAMAVYAQAATCLKVLKDIASTSESSWAEDQSFRYNAWAANSSIFTLDHASMDWRLRDNDELKNMMIDALQVLERHLTCEY
jgi:hypothetical protein